MKRKRKQHVYRQKPKLNQLAGADVVVVAVVVALLVQVAADNLNVACQVAQAADHKVAVHRVVAVLVAEEDN